MAPSEVSIFIENGYQVLVENGAGIGVGIADAEYVAHGAIIVNTEEAWTRTDVVFKYKPPTVDEYKYLHRGLNIGAIFHAEGSYELIQALMQSRVNAYTYEFFQTVEGIYPMTVVGGEVAGKMAVIYAAYHLQTSQGGRGILLSNVLGQDPAKCVVIGYGNVGSAVAIQLANMGCDVVVLGTNQEKLRKFQSIAGNRVRTRLTSQEALWEEIPSADAVFGAVLISTYNTPPLITEDMVKAMKTGSIIVDVTSGYGAGYMETFTDQTHLSEPTYTKFGVIHCKIDNLPSAVPISTAKAYSKVAAPYLLRLAESIYTGNPDYVSAQGMIFSDGQIVHPVIEEHYRHYQQQEE